MDFFMIVGMDPKMAPKYPDGTVVPNVRESYLGAPYKQLMITDEATLQCADPTDILKAASEDGYVFPVLNNGSIIAFLSVEFLYVVEDGVNEWHWGNVRLRSEYESKYYELLEAFPSAEGYSVFVVSWEHPADRFFLIKTPGGALQAYPGSRFIANLLEMSDTQLESGMSANTNELLVELKTISAEHLATRRRLEKETKEWQQKVKEKLQKENKLWLRLEEIDTLR